MFANSVAERSIGRGLFFQNCATHTNEFLHIWGSKLVRVVGYGVKLEPRLLTSAVRGAHYVHACWKIITLATSFMASIGSFRASGIRRLNIIMTDLMQILLLE
jgi:hypothetical protein